MKRLSRVRDSYHVEIVKFRDKEMGTAYFAKLFLPPNEFAAYETADEAKRHAIRAIKKLAGKRAVDIEIYVFDNKGKSIDRAYFGNLVNGKAIRYRQSRASAKLEALLRKQASKRSKAS